MLATTMRRSYLYFLFSDRHYLSPLTTPATTVNTNNAHHAVGDSQEELKPLLVCRPEGERASLRSESSENSDIIFQV